MSSESARWGRACAAALVVMLAIAGMSAQAGLRIIVIDGEGAVNVIRQNTAVAPVVEVRDKNDHPVAGVVVRFVVTKGRATLAGSRTVNVTTDATGRAAATGFSPTGAGPLQVTASATYQGQTATTIIAQTNVLSAAAAGAAGATGTAAVSGAAATTGGLSTATTVGIVGGALAGGALAVKAAVNHALPGAPTQQRYVGTFSGQLLETVVGTNPPFSCAIPQTTDGTLTITLVQTTPSVQGTAESEGHWVETSNPCGGTAFGQANQPWGGSDLPVTGTAANLTFVLQFSFTPLLAVTNAPQPDVHSFNYTFTGSLNGDTINGTLTESEQDAGQSFNGTAAVVMPVVLHLTP